MSRLVEPLPLSIPRWPNVQRVLSGFFGLLTRTQGKSERLCVVEAVRTSATLANDMTALGMETPEARRTPLEWHALVEWMLKNTQALTRGERALKYAAA